VLRYLGHEPLPILGAGWGFRFRPGGWEPAEFYFPCEDGNLGAALAPHHPLRVTWRQPGGREAADAELVEALRAGVPPIVAVDNYFLPFRPAYQDVHAAHLVVVCGVDTAARTVHVLDPMPPAYDGLLPADVLAASRSSVNDDDSTDPFFAGSGLGFRWLQVQLTGPLPSLRRAWVRAVLAANRQALLEGGCTSDGVLTGLAGFEAYVRSLPGRIAEEGGRILREIYVLGWALQASASLHADFLAFAAERLEWPALGEAGRWVDLVAHEWTAFRMAAAHGVGCPAESAAEVGYRGDALLRRWHEALTHLDQVPSGLLAP
jgi:hypothetical protein